jgi:hypothetical protein
MAKILNDAILVNERRASKGDKKHIFVSPKPTKKSNVSNFNCKIFC